MANKEYFPPCGYQKYKENRIDNLIADLTHIHSNKVDEDNSLAQEMAKYEEIMGSYNPLYYPSNNDPSIDCGQNSDEIKNANSNVINNGKVNKHSVEELNNVQFELGILYQNGIFYTRRDLTNGRFYELMSSTGDVWPSFSGYKEVTSKKPDTNYGQGFDQQNRITLSSVSESDSGFRSREDITSRTNKADEEKYDAANIEIQQIDEAITQLENKITKLRCECKKDGNVSSTGLKRHQNYVRQNAIAVYESKLAQLREEKRRISEFKSTQDHCQNTGYRGGEFENNAISNNRTHLNGKRNSRSKSKSHGHKDYGYGAHNSPNGERRSMERSRSGSRSKRSRRQRTTSPVGRYEHYGTTYYYEYRSRYNRSRSPKSSYRSRQERSRSKDISNYQNFQRYKNRRSRSRRRSRSKRRTRSGSNRRSSSRRRSRGRSPYPNASMRNRARSRSSGKRVKSYRKENSNEATRRSKHYSSNSYTRRRSGSDASRDSYDGPKSRQSNAKHSGPCWDGCMCGSSHCDFCASISSQDHRKEFTVAPAPQSNIYDPYNPITYPKQYQPQYHGFSYDYHKSSSGTKDTGSKGDTTQGKFQNQAPPKLQVVPGASDLSGSTPTLSSSSKSDRSGTLSGLSDLSSIKGSEGNMKENLEVTAKESDGSDIEEVPVPPKPTPPLVDLE